MDSVPLRAGALSEDLINVVERCLVVALLKVPHYHPLPVNHVFKNLPIVRICGVRRLELLSLRQGCLRPLASMNQ